MKEVEHQKEILEKIEKANSEEYETSWDEKGIPTSKKKSKISSGKSARARGARFELKVRENLNQKGWIVDKWTNNVDLEQNKVILAKRVYNPFKRALVIGTGFPDFIAIKHVHDDVFNVLGVEVKTNGLLSKTEKEKCAWLLQNKIFAEIWIASEKKVGRKIVIYYDDFKERYGKYFEKE